MKPKATKPQAAAQPALAASGDRIALARRVAGASLLIVSLGSSAMLTRTHFTGIGAPGCGLGGACDQAARSFWPLIGSAYFVALLVAWLASPRGVEGGFKWIVRAGVAISFVFLGAVVATRFWCAYCLATHAGNIGFWLLVETTRAAPPAEPAQRLRRWRTAITTAIVFIATCSLLAGAEWRQRRVEGQRAAGEFAESTQQMVKQSAAAKSGAMQTDQGVYAPPGGFTGRHRLGPENAPIRIVIFSDYQCRDCREMERQVKQV